MVKKVVLRQMGGSIGATIPKELSELFHLKKGDEVFIIETDRGILLTPFDPNFEKAMVVYEKGAKKYRNALNELAK